MRISRILYDVYFANMGKYLRIFTNIKTGYEDYNYKINFCNNKAQVIVENQPLFVIVL